MGPADLLPCRSLATAFPAPTIGASFFPPATAISPQLHAQILTGNYVNLVKTLLCSEGQDKCVVDCGDISVLLKDNDQWLSNCLTMPEFNVAFGVFRDVICEVYPLRRAELDTYLAIISDLAMTYGGTLFYEYHKSFSAKAAMYIQRFNQRLDWSVVDLALISRNFTSHRALSCSLCGSLAHTPSLCPRTAKPPAGRLPKDEAAEKLTPAIHTQFDIILTKMFAGFLIVNLSTLAVIAETDIPSPCVLGECTFQKRNNKAFYTCQCSWTWQSFEEAPQSLFCTLFDNWTYSRILGWFNTPPKNIVHLQ